MSFRGGTGERLQVICLVMATLWIGWLPLRTAVYAMFDIGVESQIFVIGNFATGATVIMSLLVGGVVRAGLLTDEGVKFVAVFYCVACAFFIEVITNGLPVPDFPFRAVPWTVVWIILFPLMMQLSPRQATISGLGAATATPLSFAFWAYAGGAAAPTVTVVLWSVGVYLAAACTLIPVYALDSERRAVKRAQEQVQRMGSYQLVKLLARGGVGEVWAARHDMLARPAAIKVIRGGHGIGDGQLRERFEREANATARLSSPHSVQLYDFGVTNDGSFFYVMELLNGFDLHTLIETSGPMPAQRVIFLLEQVCHSLAEAHELGLVHRDIKPANIFVCRYGLEADFVKVLDFGMVKVTHEEDTDTGVAQMARSKIKGTPAFMAPEVGRGDPLDGRTDLYSLGCVAYWMLTGRIVFPERGPVAMIVAHTSLAPEPPSQHAPSPIPAELDALVMQMLAKEPADRPASAAEVVQRLRAVVVDAEWTEDVAHQWWEERGAPLA